MGVSCSEASAALSTPLRAMIETNYDMKSHYVRKNNVHVAMCGSNFHFAKSRNGVNFLQNEKKNVAREVGDTRNKQSQLAK